MAQTTMSIRMDENLKKQFEMLCNDFGMNATTAMTVFAKAVVRERRIPFEITSSTDPFYSDANMAALRRSIAQAEAGQLTGHDLIEADDE
jgi:addiction module antitoxin, RelB/DinJ family